MQSVSSKKQLITVFLRSECAETRSNASEACPHEQYDYVSRDRVQSVSSKKQLITVFCVANAQKQGVMQARLALTSSTTMFQEIECKMQNFKFQEGEK